MSGRNWHKACQQGTLRTFYSQVPTPSGVCLSSPYAVRAGSRRPIIQKRMGRRAACDHEVALGVVNCAESIAWEAKRAFVYF